MQPVLSKEKSAVSQQIYVNKRGESENLFSFSPSAVDIYPKTFRKPIAFGYINPINHGLSESK